MNAVIQSRPGKMRKIRVAICEKDLAVRTRIIKLLNKQADFEVIGVGSSNDQAVRLIQAECPDVVFLDAQLPGLDGLTGLSEKAAQSPPLTIFVAASDKYAVQAFDAHALDYLLEPFSDERFEAALQRIRHEIRTRTASKRAKRFMRLLGDSGGISQESEYLERIPTKFNGSIVFVDVRDVDWLEATGVCVYLHVGQKKYVYSATIGKIEERLDPKKFIRVHRSTIVNTDRILELIPRTHGDYVIVLKDGTEVTLSRGYRSLLKSWIQG